jgi:hypothetical protein
MTIAKAIAKVGIKETAHDSARRAIPKILKKSAGKIPRADALEILQLVAAVLAK